MLTILVGQTQIFEDKQSSCQASCTDRVATAASPSPQGLVTISQEAAQRECHQRRATSEETATFCEASSRARFEQHAVNAGAPPHNTQDQE